MLRTSILLGCVSLAGCALPMSAPEHLAAVHDDASDRLTAGRVQKEIRVGMSGADVAAVLGSPNIVTSDEQRREVWVYDRFATDNVYSSSRGGIVVLGFGGHPGVGAAGAAGALSNSAGASSRTQRTLTVIVKFDQEHKVRDFSYRTSSF